MNLARRVTLIPRNNWDYGLSTFLSAVAGCIRRSAGAPDAERFFGQKPVWTTSGRASLYALLKGLSLPEGSSIGVPLFCCSVVFDAISKAGLKPLFIDSDPDDVNLAPDDFQNKHDRVSALVAVHMFGTPCDMDAVNQIAGGLPVVEDCAQSIYSRYKDKPAGFLSSASFFSFRCGKYISAGEGSAIFCKDSSLYEKVRKQAEEFAAWTVPAAVKHCMGTYLKALFYQRPWYGTVGHPIGTRLDRSMNLTAKGGFDTGKIAPGDLAIANARIPVFERRIEIQRRNAQLLKGLIRLKSVGLPEEKKDRQTNWYQFPLRFVDFRKRDAMALHLWKNGIDSAKYLDTIVDEAVAGYGYKKGDCPNAERASKTVLLVPIHYTLSEKDIRRIARTLNSFAG